MSAATDVCHLRCPCSGIVMMQRYRSIFAVRDGPPKWRLTVACVLLLAVSYPRFAPAAEIERITVTHDDIAFEITFDGVVDAPAQRVHDVLTDYSHLDKLSQAITAVHIEPAPDGHGERVSTVLNACVWFFCNRVVQVEDVTEPESNTIAAQIAPGAGDFKSGSSLWRIIAEGSRTRLHYEARRVVAIWVPPVIGPWAIERTMREQLKSSITVVERLANQTPGHMANQHD